MTTPATMAPASATGDAFDGFVYAPHWRSHHAGGEGAPPRKLSEQDARELRFGLDILTGRKPFPKTPAYDVRRPAAPPSWGPPAGGGPPGRAYGGAGPCARRPQRLVRRPRGVDSCP